MIAGGLDGLVLGHFNTNTNRGEAGKSKAQVICDAEYTSALVFSSNSAVMSSVSGRSRSRALRNRIQASSARQRTWESCKPRPHKLTVIDDTQDSRCSWTNMHLPAACISVRSPSIGVTATCFDLARHDVRIEMRIHDTTKGHLTGAACMSF